VSRPAVHSHIDRTSSEDVCTIIGAEPTLEQRKSKPTAGVSAKFPCRPSSDVLSNSIPLFFVARNRVGFWVARDAERRTGGIFLSRKSALRFAERTCETSGCATMFLADRLELDIENRGNRVIGWFAAALDLVTRFVPDYPPPIPMSEKPPKEEWL
jgi:hypothetical protein